VVGDLSAVAVARAVEWRWIGGRLVVARLRVLAIATANTSLIALPPLLSCLSHASWLLNCQHVSNQGHDMTYDVKKNHQKLRCRQHDGRVGLICHEDTKTCWFRRILVFVCLAATPPPAAPLLSTLLPTLLSLVLTLTSSEVLTRRRNHLSHCRAFSRRSVVIVVVVAVVVIIVVVIVFVIVIAVVVTVVIVLVIIVVVFVVVVIIVVCLRHRCCPVIMKATR
jgi:hypothetical protein